jgi:hypothetical protein
VRSPKKAITREELRGTRLSMLHESGTICSFGSYRKYPKKTPSAGNAAAQSWSPIGKVIERCFPIRHGIPYAGVIQEGNLYWTTYVTAPFPFRVD